MYSFMHAKHSSIILLMETTLSLGTVKAENNNAINDIINKSRNWGLK